MRIKDLDLKGRSVTVRQGKGGKDRVTVLPETLVEPLRMWKEEVRRLFDAGRAAGRPGALARKLPRAGERWEWFWLFPAPEESRDPDSGIVRRHHLHADSYSNAIREAAQAAGIEKWVTSHALRHTFATLLLQGGANIRTVQELWGHEDVRTTQIYTHMATGVGKTAVRSPLDGAVRLRNAECRMRIGDRHVIESPAEG